MKILNEETKQMLKNKFQCGNNRCFVNYTGNIAYHVDKKLSNSKDTTFYFTCFNSTFQIQKNGFINWKQGVFLDGTFFGEFKDGTFFNGTINGKNI